MPKHCQLGSVLSYGSEGVVYSGTWRGTLAAIKVLSNQYARRVQSEAKLVMNLDHINIIKYFDLEHEQNLAYLSMEYITGGNLYEFIRTQFTSNSYWTTVTEVLIDVARGMTYLHDHQIVQGDLKSHNILLRDGNQQAVICDFGISRLLDNDNQTVKRQNTTKGTIRWMAPEICTPPPELSSYKSDVWSYGCVILEVTSAREPWMDEFHDDSCLFRALQRRENAPIFAQICMNQSNSSHLRDLLIQCCSWSKTNRPSFNDILQCLAGKDYPEPMSIDTPVRHESSISETDHEDTFVDFKENIRRPSSRPLQVHVDANQLRKHQGRLTGEVYTSKGNASGRMIYEGPQGGRYYLAASGSKVYLHK